MHEMWRGLFLESKGEIYFAVCQTKNCWILDFNAFPNTDVCPYRVRKQFLKVMLLWGSLESILDNSTDSD